MMCHGNLLLASRLMVAAQLLEWRRENIALTFRVPTSTVDSWFSGSKRVPVHVVSQARKMAGLE